MAKTRSTKQPSGISPLPWAAAPQPPNGVAWQIVRTHDAPPQGSFMRKLLRELES